MNIIIKGTNFELDGEMKKFITEKFLRVDKFNHSIQEVRIEIEQDKHHQKGNVVRCEANVLIDGQLLRVEKKAESFVKVVNKVKDHLKLIIIRQRKKIITKQRKR